MPLLVGCDASSSAFLSTPWPADRFVVLTLVDAAGRPLETAPRTLDGDRTAIAFDTPGAVVHVETFARELAGCGARYGSDGVALPEPLEAYESTPIDDGEATFAPRTGERPVPLVFERGCAMPTPCDRATIRSGFPDLPGIDLLAVARLDSGDLFFGGQPSTIGVLPLDGAPRILGEPLDAPIVDVAVDGDRRLAVSRRGTFYTFDAAGEQTSRVRLGGSQPRLTLLDDGAAIVTSAEGSAQIARGATVAIARDDLPRETVELHVANDGETYAIARDTIQRRGDQGWVIEQTDSTIADHMTFVGDTDTVRAVGAGAIFEREADGGWRSLPYPFETLVVAGGIATGEHLLVYADSGGLALTRKDDIAWCFLDPGLISNFWDATTSADGRTVYVVGSNAAGDSPPGFVTVTLPE